MRRPAPQTLRVMAPSMQIALPYSLAVIERFFVQPALDRLGEGHAGAGVIRHHHGEILALVLLGGVLHDVHVGEVVGPLLGCLGEVGGPLEGWYTFLSARGVVGGEAGFWVVGHQARLLDRRLLLLCSLAILRWLRGLLALVRVVRTVWLRMAVWLGLSILLRLLSVW